MYEKHFSFKCKPFELLPNPDFLFQSSTHKKAITYLDYGIKEKIGFILLTGEIGSGKTTIVRNLIRNLDKKIKLARVNNTKVSSSQLISMINEEFGLDVEGKSKTKLLSELNEFLVNQYSEQTQPILLVDEAQNLSPDLLEEVRLLSNLETDKAKLLQIILVGQPELNKALMLPELIQLRQRINISYHINPLTIYETVEYIKHRLAIAGNAEAIQFQGEMPMIIYKFSRGIPRLINILCDLALLAAFVEGKEEVTTVLVKEVVEDLESRDNWNIAHNSNVVKADKKDEEEGLQALPGNIAFRIIELEEAVKKTLVEIASLAGRIDRMEDDVRKIKTLHADRVLSGFLESGARLEEMAAESEEKKIEELGVNNEKPLTEQVEVLKKMLSDVNQKLNKM